MRKLLFALSLAVLSLIPALASADDMAPGIRGDIQFSMNDAGGKVMELAAATPQAKYTWRPAKGVRSTAEVFLHVAQANYMLPMLMGVKPPISMDDMRNLDKSTTDKAKIEQTLKDSYAFANQAIMGMSDADLDAEMDFFGHKMSKRAGLLVMASHSHEHLGQSIAYARMNGITPPWTAREQAEMAKKSADKKAGGESDAHQH
jgi:uncharacterized damage-inducible protein DinB